MRACAHFFSLTLAFLFVTSITVANETVEGKQPTDLVKALGAESYQDREAAAKKLLELGLKAEEALKEGLKHKDLEVRRACRTLLADVKITELQKKITAFLADKDGKKNIDLPGWKHYQKLVGSDREARQFFIDILLTDKSMLNIVQKDPKEISSRLGAHIEKIYQVLYPPGGRIAGARPEIDKSEMGLLFLLSSYPDVTIPRNIVYKFTNFFYQSSVRNELKKENKSPFRRLFVGWVGTVTDDTLLNQLMSQANYLNIEDDLRDVAVKLMKNEKIPARSKAYALTLIGKSGTEKDIPLMEKYLDAKDVICNFGMGNGLQGKTQVRDVALAMILSITKQDHSDYNFTYTRNPNLKQHYQFNASFLGFSSDGDRNAALEKWKTWKSLHGKKTSAKKS